jgi:NitT/TauT family transport system substrate-binding protein
MRKTILSVLILSLCISLPNSAFSAEKVKIGIGGVGAMIYLQYDVARSLKFFEEQGLDPEFIFLQGGTPAASALIGGSIDFSGNAIDHALKAKMKGKDLVMITEFTRLPGMTLLVNSNYKDRIKTPADLRGYTFGVSAPGSSTHMVLVYLLKKYGIDPKDVKVFGAGISTFPPALLNDKIQAGFAADPYTTQLVESGKAYALLDLRKLKDTADLFGGEYTCTGALTRADVIKEKPEVTQKVVNALVKATRWVDTHTPEEIASILPPELVKDKKEYTDSLKHSKEMFSPFGHVSKPAFENVIKAYKTFGAIKPEMNFDWTSTYDMRFVKKALGPEAKKLPSD